MTSVKTPPPQRTLDEAYKVIAVAARGGTPVRATAEAKRIHADDPHGMSESQIRDLLISLAMSEGLAVDKI